MKTLLQRSNQWILMNQTLSDNEDRLSRIPSELRIQVIHEDDSICVVFKPSNLRSVPGHANPPPHQQLHTSRNVQTVWVTAVKSFACADTAADIKQPTYSSAANGNDEWERIVKETLIRLGNSKTVQSLPRKWKPFLRHFHRYQKQIVTSTIHQHLQSDNNATDHSTAMAKLETLAREIYQRIEERYRRLLQLPEPSPNEESALGQLILMGYGDYAAGSEPPLPLGNTPQQLLYVVHRLDCETSGVMVFARNEHAASVLSQAWRREGDGDVVTKIYWAMVLTWPPFTMNHQTAGRIDLPLAPSTTERIKWQVNLDGGKPSTTLWKVMSNCSDKNILTGTEADDGPRSKSKKSSNEAKDNDTCGNDGNPSSDPILLELTPLTGRTHQLRIHCAHVGRGIVGDSLYGANPVKWTSNLGNNRLRLHAYQLSFRHPTRKHQVQFTFPPPWNWNEFENEKFVDC